MEVWTGFFEYMILVIVVAGPLSFMVPPVGMFIFALATGLGIFSLFMQLGVWFWLGRFLLIGVGIYLVYWLVKTTAEARKGAKNGRYPLGAAGMDWIRLGKNGLTAAGILLAVVLLCGTDESRDMGPVLSFYGDMDYVTGLIAVLITGAVVAAVMQIIEMVITKTVWKIETQKK